MSVAIPSTETDPQKSSASVSLQPSIHEDSTSATVDTATSVITSCNESSEAERTTDKDLMDGNDEVVSAVLHSTKKTHQSSFQIVNETYRHCQTPKTPIFLRMQQS
jgi:restriction endonuclease Mrr